MTHQLTVSDDRYQAVVEMAAARSQTPEELLTALIDEAWERTCAPYDAAFQNDPDWQESARTAAARSETPLGPVYSSTAELFRALGASEREVDGARRREPNSEPPDSDR